MNIKALMSKVFGWMFIGLMITFATGIVVSMNPNMVMNVFDSGWLFILLIAELVLVIVLSARVMKMKPITAKICFAFYAFVSGLTFSSYFIVYDLQSIIYVFLITAALFGIFAFLGFKTKMDLSRIGNILFMALIGILLCFVVNIFTKSSTLELVASIISVIIFIGFTAYDTQKLKRLGEAGLPEDNLAIYGALELYLDFINLFIDLLRIFGNSNSND